MNALKAFVVMISMLFFAATATAASVVTLSTVPSESVGLSDAGYWAGIIKLVDTNGKQYLAMQDWPYESYAPTWYTGAATWQSNLYTQDDILGGAPVLYSPDLYSKAASFFLNGLLGYNTQDPSWTAPFSEMATNTLTGGGPPLWSYTFNQGLMNVYSGMVPGLDPNLDYRQFMVVLNSPERAGEFLAYPMMATPVPTAIWLFGSGLLGLIAVARKKTVPV